MFQRKTRCSIPGTDGGQDSALLIVSHFARAAPCLEMQGGCSAPRVEVIGSVCVWEKTGAP